MSEEPDSRIADAANAAMDAATACLEAEGLELAHAFVLLHAEGTAEGEPDSITSGLGFEDDDELLQALYIYFAGAMKQKGYDVQMIDVDSN